MNITLRNVDGGVAASMSAKAVKRGMSRNEYILGILYAAEAMPEVRLAEDRYTELVAYLTGVVNENTGALAAILEYLKREGHDDGNE